MTFKILKCFILFCPSSYGFGRDREQFSMRLHGQTPDFKASVQWWRGHVCWQGTVVYSFLYCACPCRSSSWLSSQQRAIMTITLIVTLVFPNNIKRWSFPKILFIVIFVLFCHEDVPLVEFMCLLFTRMPGESYRRRLRSLSLYCVTYFERWFTPLCQSRLWLHRLFWVFHRNKTGLVAEAKIVLSVYKLMSSLKNYEMIDDKV